jgi:hypothetical protein
MGGSEGLDVVEVPPGSGEKLPGARGWERDIWPVEDGNQSQAHGPMLPHDCDGPEPCVVAQERRWPEVGGRDEDR